MSILEARNDAIDASVAPFVMAALLASLVELCRRHGVWLVNDEVYRSVGSAPAALEIAAPACVTAPQEGDREQESDQGAGGVGHDVLHGGHSIR